MLKIKSLLFIFAVIISTHTKTDSILEYMNLHNINFYEACHMKYYEEKDKFIHWRFEHLKRQMKLSNMPIQLKTIYNANSINGFSNYRQKTVSITEGMLKKHSIEEIMGTIFHELGHIKFHSKNKHQKTVKLEKIIKGYNHIPSLIKYNPIVLQSLALIKLTELKCRRSEEIYCDNQAIKHKNYSNDKSDSKSHQSFSLR